MNVSPLGKNTSEFKSSFKTLSLSAVSAEVGADREHVAYIIKQIFNLFLESARKQKYTLSINLGVGQLVSKPTGSLQL